MAHGAECRARVEAAIVAEGDVDMRVEAAHARKRMRPREAEDVAMSAPQLGAAASSSGPRPGPTAGPQPGTAASSSGPRPGPTAETSSTTGSEDDDMHAALAALGDASPDIMEVFCPGRFTEEASAFDLRPGLAMDLRTGWNLSEPAVVAKQHGKRASQRS